MVNFDRINNLIEDLEKRNESYERKNFNEELLVGVDLGTAYIVIVVLDKDKNPVACEMEFAQVIKDGLVVDYAGARTIVKRLKDKIEEKLGVELTKAAIAVPPGTGKRDCDTHRYVVEGAGFEVTNILDEPTAANAVLNIENGVIVDVGGGTTGLSIFENGEVVYTADEATGGTHLSLVISGNYKISFEQAEDIKKSKERSKEVFNIVLPVIQKISHIIKNNIKDFNVDSIYLVGGTCCLEGIEKVIEKDTGIKTFKPVNPFLVTPLGIAMNCVV
ncbi:ethanolamine utilization protein EutJ [Clostridium tetanomorphum]|uniref:Ethanolamine utilization protein EutJ n=1 Tax=Clostridium tetanomorphum TaxID=1553 RepID=A0A923IZD1_CLOTT|nr:ethanolamine utilization protein EutJ [Clostridium tetanomorphum]KAJ52579.1 ethanolamine utilization protein EutJ [Clostridium tetanomorphum DSM 665]MBC2396867.1 ethanolamine utilization protein EutJ [Clostridium tetanomorphum]MBP1863171.1 ethanolamine utilization protein EutJ [Clostridium tetanomorphum]NRS84279.1 ethanolamine utilization protein EutJ [Clostridium tetanomorphum]NRZ97493.1 ethanolamine utilization protein EutJ [Clostridium tetanomorphum]